MFIVATYMIIDTLQQIKRYSTKKTFFVREVLLRIIKNMINLFNHTMKIKDLEKKLSKKEFFLKQVGLGLGIIGSVD